MVMPPTATPLVATPPRPRPRGHALMTTPHSHAHGHAPHGHASRGHALHGHSPRSRPCGRALRGPALMTTPPVATPRGHTPQPLQDGTGEEAAWLRPPGSGAGRSGRGESSAVRERGRERAGIEGRRCSCQELKGRVVKPRAPGQGSSRKSQERRDWEQRRSHKNKRAPRVGL